MRNCSSWVGRSSTGFAASSACAVIWWLPWHTTACACGNTFDTDIGTAENRIEPRSYFSLSFRVDAAAENERPGLQRHDRREQGIEVPLKYE